MVLTLDWRLYIQETYGDDFGHLSIFSNHQFSSPFYALSHSMNGFIDYSNRISNLNSEQFVVLLQDWQQVFNGQGLFSFDDNVRRFQLSPRRATSRYLYSFIEQYIFAVEEGWLGPGNALIENLNPYFLYHIPITDEQGRLRMGHTSFFSGSSTTTFHGYVVSVGGTGHVAIPAISASANTALAWKYIQYLISAFIFLQRNEMPFPCLRANTVLTPIMREYFRPFISNAFKNSLWDSTRGRQDILFTSEEEQAQAIEAAIGRLTVYNEMPVTPPFMIPSGLFADLLDTFLRTPPGSIFSAQEVAQELHNRVSLWLIE